MQKTQIIPVDAILNTVTMTYTLQGLRERIDAAHDALRAIDDVRGNMSEHEYMSVVRFINEYITLLDDIARGAFVDVS